MPLRILNHSWPAVTWSVIIFILLTLPASAIPSEGLFGIPQLDKVVHFILFGGLVYLWVRYLLAKTKKLDLKQVILLFFVISSAYGIGMEYFQRYVLVDRHFDYGDIFADVLGALVAAIICFRWFVLNKSKKQNS